MALTNIFREPRREITESAVGLVVFGLLSWGDYVFAQWFQAVTGDEHGHDACPWQLGMVFGVFFAFIAFLLLVLSHYAGEVICGSLAKRGLELRPKVRK